MQQRERCKVMEKMKEKLREWRIEQSDLAFSRVSGERVCQKVLALQKNPSSLFPKHSLAFRSMNTKIMCACSRLVHNTPFMYILTGSFLLLVDFSGDASESYVFKKQ